MNTTLLKELVDLGDAFEQQYTVADEQTISNFLDWANSQQTDVLPAIPVSPLIMPKRHIDSIPALPTFIVQYLTKVYRYFKTYMKKACQDSPLLNYDDFIALAHLAEAGSVTKTQMVETTVNEKTSGMLVIKRLIDQGFVEQTDNPEDRRSRYIALTGPGRAVLQSVQPGVNQATTLLTAGLSEQEQEQLARFLYRLDQIHEPLFLHHREETLPELTSRIA